MHDTTLSHNSSLTKWPYYPHVTDDASQATQLESARAGTGFPHPPPSRAVPYSSRQLRVSLTAHSTPDFQDLVWK